MQTAINLFTLRDVDDTLSRVLEHVAAAGFDGVEFIHRLPEADVDAVVETLAETGLEVPAAHLGPFVDLEEKGRAFDQTADVYEAVGCEALAVSIGDRHLETVEQVRETARRLESLADRVGERGFGLLYHNHHWEFAELDGRTRFDRERARRARSRFIAVRPGVPVWSASPSGTSTVTNERTTP